MPGELQERLLVAVAEMTLFRLQFPKEFAIWIANNDVHFIINVSMKAFEKVERYEDCAKLLEIQKQYGPDGKRIGTAPAA